MFEFLLFISVCAIIAALTYQVQKLSTVSKTKLQPIKVEKEEKRRPSRPRTTHHH